MVNPGVFHGSRKDFLESQRSLYADAVDKDEISECLGDIQRRYFKRFPVDIPLTQEPDLEWLQQVDDDAAADEDSPPEKGDLDDASFKVLEDAFQAKGKLIATRKQQIARWLSYRYRKDNQARLAAKKNPEQDPMVVLMAKLAGIPLQKPCRRTAYNIWGPRNRHFVDPIFDQRVQEGNIPKRQHAALRSSIYKELFQDTLEEDEKKEWEDLALEEHKNVCDTIDAKMSAPPPTDPVERQRIINKLPTFAQPILDLIAAYTGWKVTLIAGGPEPADNGHLNVVSVHSGVIKGTVKQNFGQSERRGYKEFVIPVFAHFLKKCYNDIEGLASVLREANDVNHDKLDWNKEYVRSLGPHIRISPVARSPSPSSSRDSESSPSSCESTLSSSRSSSPSSESDDSTPTTQKPPLKRTTQAKSTKAPTARNKPRVPSKLRTSSSSSSNSTLGPSTRSPTPSDMEDADDKPNPPVNPKIGPPRPRAKPSRISSSQPTLFGTGATGDHVTSSDVGTAGSSPIQSSTSTTSSPLDLSSQLDEQSVQHPGLSSQSTESSVELAGNDSDTPGSPERDLNPRERSRPPSPAVSRAGSPTEGTGMLEELNSRASSNVGAHNGSGLPLPPVSLTGNPADAHSNATSNSQVGLGSQDTSPSPPFEASMTSGRNDSMSSPPNHFTDSPLHDSTNHSDDQMAGLQVNNPKETAHSSGLTLELTQDETEHVPLPEQGDDSTLTRDGSSTSEPDLPPPTNSDAAPHPRSARHSSKQPGSPLADLLPTKKLRPSKPLPQVKTIPLHQGRKSRRGNTSTAGSSTSTTQTTSTGNPPYILQAQKMFTTLKSDAQWANLVVSWVAFEKSSGFTSAKALKASGRPACIGDWIQRARSTTWRPDLSGSNLDTLVNELTSWWRSLQPEWRVGEGDKLVQRDDEDLASLQHAGKNGLLSVMAGLFFWGHGIHMLEASGAKGIEKRWEAWANILSDVEWVLHALTSSPSSGS